jgi:cytidylate kinase
MSGRMLIPSIENRLGALIESTRRNTLEYGAGNHSGNRKLTITISREFGCEAYPMAECLQNLMQKKTGDVWAIMDKGLLEEVARRNDLSEKILKNLGAKAGFLDEILATFAPTWRTEKDHFRLLSHHIISLASAGNVILVGRGSANITQSMKHCYHFRIFASMEFKISSIAQRMELSDEEAEKLIIKKQQERNMFIKAFLNQDGKDPSLYHIIFNNDKNNAEKIASTIMEYLLGDS